LRSATNCAPTLTQAVISNCIHKLIWRIFIYKLETYRELKKRITVENKIDIYEILIESYQLLRKHLKLFLSISLLMVFLTFIIGFLIQSIGKLNTEEQLIIYPLTIGTFLIGVYFQMRFSIVLFYAIKNKYELGEFNFSETFLFSKKIFWHYLKTSLSLAIYLIVPVILLSIGVAFFYNIIVKALLIILGIIIALYFTIQFGLSPLIAIFNIEEKKPLDHSKHLCSLNSRQVLYTFIAIIIIELLVYFIGSLWENSPSIQFKSVTYYILHAIVEIFSTPFIMGISVILYIKLNKIESRQTETLL
jgi:hypothetical protein